MFLLLRCCCARSFIKVSKLYRVWYGTTHPITCNLGCVSDCLITEVLWITYNPTITCIKISTPFICVRFFSLNFEGPFITFIEKSANVVWTQNHSPFLVWKNVHSPGPLAHTKTFNTKLITMVGIKLGDQHCINVPSKLHKRSFKNVLLSSTIIARLKLTFGRWMTEDRALIDGVPKSLMSNVEISMSMSKVKKFQMSKLIF